MTETKKTKKSFFLKLLLGLILVGIIVGAGIAWYGYQLIFESNVKVKSGETAWLYVPKGATYDDVYDSLKVNNLLKNNTIFDWVAQKKNLAKHIYPGRYKIEAGMNNNSLINRLRSGDHTAVNVTFNYLRTTEDLAGRVARYIDSDSLALLVTLRDSELVEGYGFDAQTFMGMFIPNTYKFNWSTNAEEFVARMAKEYKRFWKDRMAKADKLGFTPNEVTTLASIVQTETSKADERRTIAGVYMNRIQRGIPLQADPTLIFALGDFSIRRVLNKHKEIDSPYNTYMYPGLPPGPICLPEIGNIDAVLNYEKHDYLFFCAKEDFSGYSNFAKTNAEHERNARKYQQALNKRGVFK